MVRSTAKSTYFKELLFPFFKIFYTLIVHYVINFVFSIGKQPYRDAGVGLPGGPVARGQPKGRRASQSHSMAGPVGQP